MNANREAENTRRAFYRELRKVLGEADVLCMILNKIDLIPQEALAGWMKHLQTDFPTIAFKAATTKTNHASHAHADALDPKPGLLQSSTRVVGADNLMQLLKNYARGSGGAKKAIQV